jgi:hypothetical protein
MSDTDAQFHAIKSRLRAWAHVHAGAQYRRLGYAATDALKGSTAPSEGDAQGARLAAEIELIVLAMERAGRWRECRVLRAEHFLEALPEKERLQRLARIGLRMSRSTYYTYLRSAHSFLLGALLHQQDGQGEAGACP